MFESKRKLVGTMNELKMIEKKAQELNNDMEQVRKALRRVQSMKCNLLKQKGRSDYEAKMAQTLAEEQILKEVRSLLEPKGTTVTTMTQSDIDMLDFDQTVKAIKSIQSKKTHTRWLTDVEGDNDEFRRACHIESMLLRKRSNRSKTLWSVSPN